MWTDDEQCRTNAEDMQPGAAGESESKTIPIQLIQLPLLPLQLLLQKCDYSTLTADKRPEQRLDQVIVCEGPKWKPH